MLEAWQGCHQQTLWWYRLSMVVLLMLNCVGAPAMVSMACIEVVHTCM